MFRYLRFYLTPLTMLLVAGCMLLGGMWLWIPATCYVVSIALLDQLFPKDVDERPYQVPFALDGALYASLPATVVLFLSVFWVCGSGSRDFLQAGALFQQLTGFDAIAARNATQWWHYAIMLLALAIPITASGGLAGHELTHRTARPFDLWLGRIMMALNWGIAFPVEHVYGHHAYVGTSKDPATAARGDSIYRHLPKAMYRTVANALEIESARLHKRGRAFWSLHNVLLRMGIVAVAMTATAWIAAGWHGLMIYLALCTLTKVLLEALNYVEHYGIVREPAQPVQPRHSWNCNHLVSGVFSYNLTRHSHHHADAQVHFQDLRAMPDQPEIPGGLLTAFLTQWIPPLWRKRIAPKLQEWDKKYASREELELVRAANQHSHWPELQSTALT